MRRSVAIGGGAVVLLALVLAGCYLAALRIGERDLAAATARISTVLRFEMQYADTLSACPSRV